MAAPLQNGDDGDSPAIDEFLKPLAVDLPRVRELAGELADVFRELSANSPDQFLPTPISESILRRPVVGQHCGRYVASLLTKAGSQVLTKSFSDS